MDALKIVSRITAYCLISCFIWTSCSLWASPLTDAQIEQLKSLPPAQQQKMAKAYGIDIQSLNRTSKQPTKNEDADLPSLQPRANEPTEDVVNTLLEEPKLKPFGYDLFAAAPSTFAQVSNVPVPNNYTLGPGDTIKVQLFGKTSNLFELTIDRDGNVYFPELGPISLAGQTYTEVRKTLQQKVKEQIIGVNISVTMGELRSIQIFVLGDAFKPGLYTISALSNISHALYLSGGIANSGSLRNVQLKRGGELVSELDLYDLLLRGDTSNDVRLLPGDVVFIPPARGTISIDGEVRRPAIYEIKQGETLDDALQMAGGLLPEASPSNGVLMGFDQDKVKRAVSIDFHSPMNLKRPLTRGDYIQARAAKSSVETGVLLIGAVAHPGFYTWKKGLKFSDIVPSTKEGLLSSTDLDYALIMSENLETGEVTLRQLSIRSAIDNKGSSLDLTLRNRDKILCFNKVTYVAESATKSSELAQYDRDAVIDQELLTETSDEQKIDPIEALRNLHEVSPSERKDILVQAKDFVRAEMLGFVMEKLASQAKPGSMAKIATIGGAVKSPGSYPLIENAKLTDLIDAAGGMLESADLSKAELTRTFVTDDSEVRIEHLSVSALKAYKSENENIAILPKDVVNIMQVPGWQDNPIITIKGEVRYPGVYSLRRGETIMDLLARVGGFTPFADVYGVVFTRKAIKKRQQQQLQRLGEQLRKQLASLSLRRTEGMKSSLTDYEMMQKLIEDLSAAEPVGRLVINMPEILAGNQSYNLQVENGDSLFVPPKSTSVSVIGEVQLEGTHFYTPDLNLDDYLERSGGVKAQADDGRIYIVRSSGDVVIPNKGISLFSSDVALNPGDTIVVPLNTEYMDNLSLWSTATGILYNTAVAVAAIGAL